MDLKSFVNDMPCHLFDALRKVIVDRHQREAAEFVQLLKHLQENGDASAIKEDFMGTIQSLFEETGYSPELCMKAVGKFLELEDKKSQGLPVDDLFAQKENEDV